MKELTTKKESTYITNQVIDLKDLSPTLRKIAATLLQSPEPLTVKPPKTGPPFKL